MVLRPWWVCFLLASPGTWAQEDSERARPRRESRVTREEARPPAAPSATAGQGTKGPERIPSGWRSEVEAFSGAILSIAEGEVTYSLEAGTRIRFAHGDWMAAHVRGSYLRDVNEEELDSERHPSWVRVEAQGVAAPLELVADSRVRVGAGPFLYGLGEENTPSSIERELIGAAGIGVKAEATPWEGVVGLAWTYSSLEIDDDLPEERGFPRESGLRANPSGAGLFCSFRAGDGPPGGGPEIGGQGRCLFGRGGALHAFAQELSVRVPLGPSAGPESSSRLFLQLTVGARYLDVAGIHGRDLRGFEWDFYVGPQIGVRF